MAHSDQKYVYHAVHMTFSGSFEEAWQPDERRESKMVFIGRDLEEDFLVDTFNKARADADPAPRSSPDPPTPPHPTPPYPLSPAHPTVHRSPALPCLRCLSQCLATAENLQRKASTLRFKVGAPVQCRTAEGAWCAGTVEGQLIRGEGMTPGVVAQYQVRLQDGRAIPVMTDCATVIRAADEPEDEVVDCEVLGVEAPQGAHAGHNHKAKRQAIGPQ